MLTPEQTEKIKKQLIQHIADNFPEDKKEFAINQIEAMNSEKLEAFLRQNKLVKSEGEPEGCIFCSIVSGQIDSHKIDENKSAVAVLEINPITQGHVIVIPREHTESSEKVPEQAFSLAKTIAKKIKSKLSPKNVRISSSNLFGHEIINVIPIYDEEEPKERHQTNPEELADLQKLLKKRKAPVKKPKVKKIKAKKQDEKLWLPKRIP